MRSEKSWSLLDPRPMLLHVNRLDEYIVYWNGVVTTHAMAMNAAMEYYGIYPTPEMKTAMEKEYERIYYSYGFETRAWDAKVSSSPIYPYIKRILKDHMDRVISEQEKDISEVLEWFDYKRARIED
jgi:hypothetical protein